MQEVALHLTRSTLLTRGNYPGGRIPRRGNRTAPPNDTYPCAPGGEADYIMIAVLGDALVRRLLEAIGRPELSEDPRFSSLDARMLNGDSIWEEIAAWTRGRTKWEAMHHLAKSGVPASAVFDAKDIDADPHLAARGAIETLEHPRRGQTRVPGNPVRLHGSEIKLTAPPWLGEHTRDVLHAELGLDNAALDRLAAAGTIGEG